MSMLLESQVYWRLLGVAQQVSTVDQVRLFDWICSLLPGALNTAALDDLTLAQLQQQPLPELASLSAAQWQGMLDILHGQLPDHLNPRPLSAAQSAGQLRVAFASCDGLLVNGHFGTCPLFFIYQLDEHGSQLVDIRRFSVWQQTHGTPGGENNEARSELLQGCHLLFCEAIGGPAAARVIRHGIHPIKIKKDPQIQTQLTELSALMQDQLPPWLAKVLGRKDNLANRFDITIEE